MKTPMRMKPKAMSPGGKSSAPASSWIISAPASGNTAYAATSPNTSRRGWRRRMPSTITAVTAIATAGAGPSRAIASTRLMNDPQMRRRTLPVSNGNRWLPTDSAAMSTTTTDRLPLVSGRQRAGSREGRKSPSWLGTPPSSVNGGTSQ